MTKKADKINDLIIKIVIFLKPFAFICNLFIIIYKMMSNKILSFMIMCYYVV